MANFDEVEHKVQQEAQGHAGQVDEAVSKGEQEIDREVGQQHGSQVETAGTEVEKALGAEPSPSGSPTPDQQSAQTPPNP